MISPGELSGRKAALSSALKQRGCEVIECQQSLRNLRLRPLHALRMVIHALLIYGPEFKRFLDRTYASYAIKSRVNEALIRRHSNVDAVILLALNSQSYWKMRNPGIPCALYTDHVNLLSKQLPDYGFQIPEKRVYARWNELERIAMSQVDHIFVMASYVKQSIIEDYGIDPKKVSVVRAGPPLDIDIERDGFLKDYQARNILFVGLEPARKGLDVLRKAYSQVAAVYPDATLQIVGTEGATADGIIYHGKLYGEPLKKLLYASQVFALPAFREPFGNVIVEAMWAKCACIGTNTGAMPEIIEHGKSGFIIEPGDEEALAQGILQLFDSPELLRDIAERGYQRASAKYSWEKVTQKMIERLR